MDAPIHRLAPAIDVAALHEIEKRAGDGGFIVEAHGQVRIIPPAEDAEALEVALMLLDVARRKLAAELTELRRRDLAFANPFPFALTFAWQPTTIPSGQGWRVIARHA